MVKLIFHCISDWRHIFLFCLNSTLGL
uniref:Uncharacterized protein n=1 Tax=Anguilla anguilla TaxID=7936 RepID=A0A0E9RG11_ANGAN